MYRNDRNSASNQTGFNKVKATGGKVGRVEGRRGCPIPVRFLENTCSEKDGIEVQQPVTSSFFSWRRGAPPPLFFR